MTVDQLSAVTKGELARLHPLSKRQFMANVNNFTQVITGHADNIACGRGDAIEAALTIARTARKWHQELEQLFAASSPEVEDLADKLLQNSKELVEPAKVNRDAHLGAEYKP